jgi:hypothetical protein
MDTKTEQQKFFFVNNNIFPQRKKKNQQKLKVTPANQNNQIRGLAQ